MPDRTPVVRAWRAVAPHVLALSLVAATLPLGAPSAHAYSSSTSRHADPSELDNHRSYRNRDGDTIHAPAHSKSNSPPAGATARCRDGAYSFSRHRRGTCSGHGGVDAWL
ncbi:DUF3761 domain-containing protein [Burkholderia sp. TSV86]|uniref:DUF3761 domain-containing protein n=1 Tax=Burkholderia sp. TSV86 TaxID=1385594 RepID=UPI000751E063|nr:DUF3761 domain-containing protein [Burkholderia sp. TSV86]KVE34660.1 hypothetical protein WS68_09295 [Burkholderia sp. TSV86]